LDEANTVWLRSKNKVSMALVGAAILRGAAKSRLLLNRDTTDIKRYREIAKYYEDAASWA